jgi:hypothetical protein
MSATCSCVYKVNAFGALSSDLAASIEASNVPVDQSILDVTGATVFSDNTVDGGSSATRTIVLTLTPTFKQRFPDGTDQKSPFWNFMTGLLQKAAISPVVAAAPVLA